MLLLCLPCELMGAAVRKKRCHGLMSNKVLGSYEPLSRDNGAMEASLADVLAAVRNSDLPERRRQELASAVRTVARALGRPPGCIPADPRRLSGRLKEVAPLAINVSQRRWNNIRALLRTGLTMVQHMSPGRHLNKLSPDWEPLWQRLTSRRLRMKFTRFLRFCSASGIGPARSPTQPSPPIVPILMIAC